MAERQQLDNLFTLEYTFFINGGFNSCHHILYNTLGVPLLAENGGIRLTLIT